MASRDAFRAARTSLAAGVTWTAAPPGSTEDFAMESRVAFSKEECGGGPRRDALPWRHVTPSRASGAGRPRTTEPAKRPPSELGAVASWRFKIRGLAKRCMLAGPTRATCAVAPPRPYGLASPAGVESRGDPWPP